MDRMLEAHVKVRDDVAFSYAKGRDIFAPLEARIHAAKMYEPPFAFFVKIRVLERNEKISSRKREGLAGVDQEVPRDLFDRHSLGGLSNIREIGRATRLNSSHLVIS